MASRNVFGMVEGCSEGGTLRPYPSRFVGPIKAINGVPMVRVGISEGVTGVCCSCLKLLDGLEIVVLSSFHSWYL
jgi:hypothetical protein